MVTSEDFEYYFEEVGRGVNEGAQDPRAEHFTASAIESSVVRETIQNSLDARRDADAPVQVVFSLAHIPTASIPGIDGLREASRLAEASGQSVTEGHERIVTTRRHLEEDVIPLLGISDHGTTGLDGDENDDDGGLAALTRSSGVSSSGRGRGGSFGIGAAAGVLASGISTVGYLTRRAAEPETIYASWTQLSRFTDRDGHPRRARGTLTRIDERVRLSYPRFRDEGFGPFAARQDLGTTVLVYDYVGADADPQLLGVRRVVAFNFLVAILEGALIVEGRTAQGTWRLDEASIHDAAAEDPTLAQTLLPFLQAMAHEPIRVDLPRIGRVELHIAELEDASPGRPGRAAGTMVMRRPRMLIEVIENRGLPKPYAAVFICRDDEGNELLRRLEGPSHAGWKKRGTRGDGTLVHAVRMFIRESLRERLGSGIGEELEVTDLHLMLPSVLDTSDGPALDVDGPQDGETETWTSRSAAEVREGRGARAPRPHDPGSGPQGGEPGGGSDAGRHPGGGDDGTSGGGSETGSSALLVRTFAADAIEADTTMMVLRNPTDSAIRANFEIAWLDGADTSAPLTIETARDADDGAELRLPRSKGSLRDIEVPASSRRRILIRAAEGSRVKLKVVHRGE